MVWSSAHSLAGMSVWALVRAQDGVVAHWQLVVLGYSRRAIEHRLASGRLHCLLRGVYAVGRAEVTTRGRFTAAVLACGQGAALCHFSGGALWEVCSLPRGRMEVVVPYPRQPRHPGIRVYRRKNLRPEDIADVDGIPVTAITATLTDLATRLGTDSLEDVVNRADKRDLIDPETLRGNLDRMPPRPGVARLRRVLDLRTFTLTDSELERRFLRIVRRAGLPSPQTQVTLNGYRVDFFWPDLGLVVETDGLRYHRTPSQQARDRVRDQAHTAAGLTPLRFTRAQVRFEPDAVEATLVAVATRLSQAVA